MKPLILFVVWMITSLLVGCSSNHIESNSITKQSQNMAHSKIMSFYEQWYKTPYRLGGNSKYGIDCSAFIQRLMMAAFNHKLPRTTKEQVELGRAISQQQLQMGDLIFFKTGPTTRHVGLYISDTSFVHASTSKGVITSSMLNPYWQAHYWQSRRVL